MSRSTGTDTHRGTLPAQIAPQMRICESLVCTSFLTKHAIPTRTSLQPLSAYERRVESEVIDPLLAHVMASLQLAASGSPAVLQDHSPKLLKRGNGRDEGLLKSSPNTWRAALLHLQWASRVLTSFTLGYDTLYAGMRDAQCWLPSTTDAWAKFANQDILDHSFVALGSNDEPMPPLVANVKDAFPDTCSMMRTNPPEVLAAAHADVTRIVKEYQEKFIWASVERIWKLRSVPDINLLQEIGIINDQRAAGPAAYQFGRVCTNTSERKTHSWHEGVYGCHGVDITSTSQTAAQLATPDPASPIDSSFVFAAQPAPAPAPTRPAHDIRNHLTTVPTAPAATTPTHALHPTAGFVSPSILAPAVGAPPAPRPHAAAAAPTATPATTDPTGAMSFEHLAPPPRAASPAPATTTTTAAHTPAPAFDPVLFAQDIQRQMQEQLQAALNRQQATALATEAALRQGQHEAEQRHQAQLRQVQQELDDARQQLAATQGVTARPPPFLGVRKIDHDPHGHTPPAGSLIHVYKTRTYLLTHPDDVGSFNYSDSELAYSFYRPINAKERVMPDVAASGAGEHLWNLCSYLNRVYDVLSAFGVAGWCFTNGYPMPDTEPLRRSYRSMMNLVCRKIRESLVSPHTLSVCSSLQNITMPAGDHLPFTPDHNIVYRYLVRIKAHVLSECSIDDLTNVEEACDTSMRQEWKYWDTYVQSFKPLAQICIEFNLHPDMSWVTERLIRFMWEDSRLDHTRARTWEMDLRPRLKADLADYLARHRRAPDAHPLTWDALNDIASRTLGLARLMRPPAALQSRTESFPGSGTARGYEGPAPNAIPMGFAAAAHPSYMLVHDVARPGEAPTMRPYSDNGSRRKRVRSSSRDRSASREREHSRNDDRDRRGKHGRPDDRSSRAGPTDADHARSRPSSHVRSHSRDRSRSRSHPRDDHRQRYADRPPPRDVQGDGCWHCGAHDHIARDCPKNCRNGRAAPPLPDPTPPGAQANLASAMIASAPAMPQDFHDGRR